MFPAGQYSYDRRASEHGYLGVYTDVKLRDYIFINLDWGSNCPRGKSLGQIHIDKLFARDRSHDWSGSGSN